MVYMTMALLWVIYLGYRPFFSSTNTPAVNTYLSVHVPVFLLESEK